MFTLLFIILLFFTNNFYATPDLCAIGPTIVGNKTSILCEPWLTLPLNKCIFNTINLQLSKKCIFNNKFPMGARVRGIVDLQFSWSWKESVTQLTHSSSKKYIFHSILPEHERVRDTTYLQFSQSVKECVIQTYSSSKRYIFYNILTEQKRVRDNSYSHCMHPYQYSPCHSAHGSQCI